MDFAALALEFAIDLVASAAFLWVGMKVANQGPRREALAQRPSVLP